MKIHVSWELCCFDRQIVIGISDNTSTYIITAKPTKFSSSSPQFQFPQELHLHTTPTLPYWIPNDANKAWAVLFPLTYFQF
jgi:hypothetical protein